MGGKVVVPAEGKRITLQDGKLNISENPITPFIEGDGIGVDVIPPMIKVVDVVVEKIYRGEHKVSWMKIYTGEKSTQVYGQNVQLSAETLGLIREYHVAIKGSLTTLAGDDIRFLNVALRQELDLYARLRPARYYQDTPSPVKHPKLTDMVIFRKNSGDIYAGIEWKADSADTKKVIKFLREEIGVKKIRFLGHCGIGVRPCSEEGTKRPVRAVIEYAIANDRDSVILIYKGNIMESTEGAFKDQGYQLTCEEFGDELIDGGSWVKIKSPRTDKGIVVKDVIVDAFLQQILLHPAEYDVIACMNLSGNYISDVPAVQIDGTGITPGANIGDECALFETTHGIVPRYAGQDKVNPGSIILSAKMMLCRMGWVEAADLIAKGMEGTIGARTVTYGFERLMDGIKLLKCSEFGDTIVENV